MCSFDLAADRVGQGGFGFRLESVVCVSQVEDTTVTHLQVTERCGMGPDECQ